MLQVTQEPPVPASLRKRVRTLGHGLQKLAGAWSLLGVRLERGLLDEQTAAWIRKWSGDGFKEALPLPVDSSLEARIVWSGRDWRLEALVKGESEKGFVGQWPVVLMLLHLPALRDFWRPALRAQRFAWLKRALPQVWALDVAQPVRPGTVIAGLDITRWEDLPKAMAAGRRFQVVRMGDGTAESVFEHEWPAHLDEAGDELLLLREAFSPEPEGRVQACWKHDAAGRVVADRVRITLP